MELAELKKQLEEKLDKQITSRVFLDRMRVLDEESRKSAAYNDPKYVPFYYWLGTFIQPKSLVELGFRLGLFSGNFLRGCKTVERFLGYQEKTAEYYSPKLGKSNVKDHFKGQLDIYHGSVNDEAFEKLINKDKWGCAIVNEEVGYDRHREFLDVLWSKLDADALIVMDYVNRHKPATEAYMDFCRIKSREPVIIHTRYGVGLIKR